MRRPRPAVLGLVVLVWALASATAWGGEYIVGPGDVLRVDAYDAEKMSGKFPVDSQGYIRHFILGRIKVGGKTIPRITADMEGLLSKGYVRDPKVTVAVEEYHSQEVFVLGEVARPGAYGLRGDNLLLDVLLQAGGPTPGAGDRVSILRRGAEGTDISAAGTFITHLSVNVGKLLVEGDLEQNIPIQKGDVIYLPRNEREDRTFFVVGQVKTPGAYKLKDGYTVLNAILDAGGFTKYAKGNGTKLIRGKGGAQEIFILKMADVLEDGDRDKDMRLVDGDLVVVPSGIF